MAGVADSVEGVFEVEVVVGGGGFWGWREAGGRGREGRGDMGGEIGGLGMKGEGDCSFLICIDCLPT